MVRPELDRDSQCAENASISNEVKTRRGRIGNPHIPVRGRSAYVIVPYSIASLTVKHASAIQGKLGEVGSRVRGTLTCSMFGNLTGTYPGIQAAFYEPERQPIWARWLQI